MSNASDIQAGRATIQVVLDDSTIAEQMRTVTARMKAAAAGLSAGSIPILAADVAGPARKYEAAIKSVTDDFRSGALSAKEYEQKLAQVAQQYTANATPAQRLGVQMAELDAAMQRGDISAAEYDRQMTGLLATFNRSATPIDQFEAQLAALDRDFRSGQITEQQYREGLQALHNEFKATAKPAEQMQAELRTLNAQLAAGVITNDQHAAAVKRVQEAMQKTKETADKKYQALVTLRSQVVALASGYLSFNAILGLTRQALEYVRAEVDKAKQSQDRLVDSRRKLVDVANDKEDFQSMVRLADIYAHQYGVTRDVAYGVTAQARAGGYEDLIRQILSYASVTDLSTEKSIADVAEKIASGETEELNRRRQILAQSPGEQARRARIRAEIEREIANEEQYSGSGAAAEEARNEALAAMKFAGRTGWRQWQAEKVSGLAETLGAGPDAVRAAIAKVYEEDAQFFDDLAKYREHVRKGLEEVRKLAQQETEGRSGKIILGSTAAEEAEKAGEEAKHAAEKAREEARAKAEEHRKKLIDRDRETVPVTMRHIMERHKEAEEERKKLAAKEEERRRLQHADTAGTFSGWRLGAQFGTTKTLQDQLAELRKIAHNTDKSKEKPPKPEVYL